MLNDRWAKRILRAAKTIVTSKEDRALKEFEEANPLPSDHLIMIAKDIDGAILMQAKIFDARKNIGIGKEFEMNKVKNHEKIMNYLQQENLSGHAHNLDMLLASLNLNQHLREAFLWAEVKEDEEKNAYILSFPFGIRTIEFILSKKAIENG